MLEFSGNSQQGQALEKFKALCSEQGCLLIFDKQDVVVASPSVHISEQFPEEAQGIGGSLKQRVSQAQDTTLLSPKPLLCH